MYPANRQHDCEYLQSQCRKFPDLVLQPTLGEEYTVTRQTIGYITCSLNSPNIGTRRAISEILFFFHRVNEMFHEFVLDGFSMLSAANNETGVYDYWMKSFEAALDGRGKMGSLVGASSEVRKTAGPDSALNEYAVSP